MPRSKKTGEPPATITFRLEPQLRKKLRRRADEQSTSEQHVVTQALTDHLSSDSLAQRVGKLEAKVDGGMTILAQHENDVLGLKHRMGQFELAVDGSAAAPAQDRADQVDG